VRTGSTGFGENALEQTLVRRSARDISGRHISARHDRPALIACLHTACLHGETATHRTCYTL